MQRFDLNLCKQIKEQKLKILHTLPLILVSLFLLINTSDAQKKKLTYEQVYLDDGEKIIGSTPSLLGWFDEENYVERKNKNGENEIVKVNALSGKQSVLVDLKSALELLPEGIQLYWNYEFTKDYSAMVVSAKNNLYYIQFDDSTYKQLTNDDAEENNPHFSPDGKFVAYTKEKNLFYYDISEEREFKLTNDGSDVIYNGYSSWVYYEEILGRRSRYAAFWWSPDSKLIAFLKFDDSPVPQFPIYNSEGTHGTLEWQRYPKAGDPLPIVKLGIVSLETKDITWVDIDSNNDQMIAWPFWSADSKQLLFQWMNRAQDNLKIYTADPVNGTVKEIYDEKQSSWVEFFEDIYCFKNDSGFILRSDKSGWSHLYYYDYSGKLISQITSGDWAVTGISLVNEANEEIYFTGSVNESTENHLYKAKLDGSGLTQLTSKSGMHRVEVSPGGNYFYDEFNNITTPSITNLYTSSCEFIRELGNSKLSGFDEYNLGKVELFKIPSGDGYELPAYWVLPPDFEPTKKYPVLFKEYGGPGSKSVQNDFPRLSDFYYAQRGIIIFSVDHRGAGHFGKEGTALMHRNLGKWEMHDYTAAVKWLLEKPFIDSTKIGISGGSYGGYVTCLALTKEADYFTHGVAEFSVTDWHLYDNVYTERYMDTPAENPDGYKEGSVLTYVDNYKGYLRITHGTMDDNVHMQNTIQLVDALIDKDKDFELMLYPGERHGFRGAGRKHDVRETNEFWFKNFLK